MRDRELVLVIVALGLWSLCALDVVPYRGHLVPNPVRSVMSFAHEVALLFRDAGDVYGFGQDTSSRATPTVGGRSAATGQYVGPVPGPDHRATGGGRCRSAAEDQAGCVRVPEVGLPPKPKVTRMVDRDDDLLPEGAGATSSQRDQKDR